MIQILTKLARKLRIKRIFWLKHYKAYIEKYPKTPLEKQILSLAKKHYHFAKQAYEENQLQDIKIDLPVNSNRWDLFETGMQENIASSKTIKNVIEYAQTIGFDHRGDF